MSMKQLINSHDKGKRHEYYIRDILKSYGFDAQRSPMSGAIKGFGLEADILSKSFPYFIEAKDDKKASFLKWWKKAQSESLAKPAIIIWTINYEDEYCFLRFTDLLDMMKKGIVTKNKKIDNHKRISLDESSQLKFNKKFQTRKAERL